MIFKDSKILQNRCQTIDSLKSAVVGIFIQQKYGNITNLGFSFSNRGSLPAYHYLYDTSCLKLVLFYASVHDQILYILHIHTQKQIYSSC